jgi:dihydroorotase
METMSKFLYLGMPLPEIVRAVTATPAGVLKRPDLADLSIGTTGDVTVMRIEEGQFTFEDVSGNKRSGRQRFALDSMVVGGALWHSVDTVGEGRST